MRIQKQEHGHPFTEALLHDLHVVLILLEDGHPGEGEHKSPGGSEWIHRQALYWCIALGWTLQVGKGVGGMAGKERKGKETTNHAYPSALWNRAS